MGGNLLGAETSPYLLQHRDNPVHWRPWGQDALAEARAADKPILLSVGYSACHWCHVMAHESFEDEETAALMNALFVNVKVDREERPDLDTIYQRALALTGQQGGWPLTMFLTPDGAPFWGGTYFPREPRFGRPGFKDVLRLIDRTWRGDRERVDKNKTSLVEALRGLARSKPGAAVTDERMETMARTLLREVDGRHGGIGGAPKFPQCGMLELLWRNYRRTGSLLMKTAVVLTMERMALGGIYDHLGGGFARYSTDERWLAPHFEKMLYDNAQILDLLCHVWQDTGETLFAARAAETVGWVLREMRTGEGAFASALDADSEGEEGRFYVWSETEIDDVLGAETAYFKAVYDVTASGNWEGRTILNRLSPPRTDEALDEAAAGPAAGASARAARTPAASGLGRQGARRLERPDDRRPRQRRDGLRRAGLAGGRPRGLRLRRRPHGGRPALAPLRPPRQGERSRVPRRLRGDGARGAGLGRGRPARVPMSGGRGAGSRSSTPVTGTPPRAVISTCRTTRRARSPAPRRLTTRRPRRATARWWACWRGSTI